MMELERYWTRRKWKALVAIVLGAAALFASAALLSGVADLVNWLSSAWNVVGTTERLQILSFAVNGLLTTVLVGATCLYAWLTWRMVNELQESRQLGKRPALVVDLGDLEVGPGHGYRTKGKNTVSSVLGRETNRGSGGNSLS